MAERGSAGERQPERGQGDRAGDDQAATRPGLLTTRPSGQRGGPTPSVELQGAGATTPTTGRDW
ncbi:hypothetical protein C0708_22590 [Aeromonas caviae]|nr:hypothetical protein C0708_22590 [Aeromonas caviae]